jgi:hypothetical protein
MTRIRARLDRLYPGLSPKERVTLVVRAWKQGREPDHRLLTSRSDSEALEYNRLIGLVRAAGELTQYLVIISLLVGQLEIKLSWYLTAVLWDNASAGGERSREIADAVLNGLVDGVPLHWRELRSLESLLAEIADELDGEDVLHPEARALFDETKEKVQELRDAVARHGAGCELTEPDAAEVEALAKVIEAAS